MLQDSAVLVKQNNQLKLKYKKALQQLMHILKINNSLKEHMDKNNSALNVQFKEHIESIKSHHHAQIQKLFVQQKQLSYKIDEEVALNQKIQRNLNACQIERNQLKAELSNILSNKKVSQEIQKQKSQGYEQQKNRITNNQKQKDPYESKNKLLLSLQQEKQKLLLQEQIKLLKEKEKSLTLELLNQKQKYRNDILKRDQENLKFKQSEEQKLTNIKSKYNLLQNELNGYKNSQKYYQFEVKPLFDYEQTLESMRQQFQKMNNDFSRYELDYSKIVVKSEEDDKNAKIMYLQAQNYKLKRQQYKLNQTIKELQIRKDNLFKIEQKLKTVQIQKSEILQRNNILQALLITQKYRENNHGTTERIKQFETRVKLMISQKGSIDGYGGYHQITILKGYIEQLSQTLNRLKKRQQHLHKKSQTYKNQLAEAERNYNQRIEQLNNRIINYDTLINKLYKALEEKIKSNVSEQIEKEFNNALRHYEEKMISMSEQIILLRKTNEQLLAKEQNKEEQNRKDSRIDELQQENSTYRKLVSEFKDKVQSLQDEYSNLSGRVTIKINELQQQISQRNNTIDKLTIENEKLIHQNKENYQNMELKISSYQQEILQLRKEGNKKHHQQYYQTKYEGRSAALPDKTDYPQFQLLNQRSISIQSINSNPAEEQIKVQNAQIASQASQIRQYKEQIDQLKRQLQKQKSNSLHNNNQMTTVLELQRQLQMLQTYKKNTQFELTKTIQRYNSQQVEWRQDIENLKYQNRGLIEQLKSKQNELMVYYDELNKSNNLQEKQNSYKDAQQAHQIIEKSNVEIKELNSQIITLRTNNIYLKNQLQAREDTINQLKHDIFKAELQNQKARSSGSILKENKNQIDNQTLLVLLVITFAEVESLRQKNQELNLMYHQNQIKYSLVMKELENRQSELKDKPQRSHYPNNNPKKTLFENVSLQDSIQAPLNEENEESDYQKFAQNQFRLRKNY